jgi:1-acyl-sn-glycerol-3-phosphate acyltransferase
MTTTAGTTGTVIVDHAGARVSRTHWRTYLVLLHTLSNSVRIVSRSLTGRLQRNDVERVFHRWTKRIFDISQLTLVAHGVDNVRGVGACVVICNHVSLLDTPCIIESWPGSVRFIGKMELRRVPVFGKAMEDAGVVFVDREDRQKAIGQLEAAKRLLHNGYALWVAAEGKRSRDGKLRAFKKGAFHTAIALGVPLVPSWIEGTLDVIPPDQWRATTGKTVTVAYGKPIPTLGKSAADIPALVAEVRARMLELAQLCGAAADVDAGADA